MTTNIINTDHSLFLLRSGLKNEKLNMGSKKVGKKVENFNFLNLTGDDPKFFSEVKKNVLFHKSMKKHEQN